MEDLNNCWTSLTYGDLVKNIRTGRVASVIEKSDCPIYYWFKDVTEDVKFRLDPIALSKDFTIVGYKAPEVIMDPVEVTSDCILRFRKPFFWEKHSDYLDSFQTHLESELPKFIRAEVSKLLKNSLRSNRNLESGENSVLQNPQISALRDVAYGYLVDYVPDLKVSLKAEGQEAVLLSSVNDPELIEKLMYCIVDYYEDHVDV